MLGLIENVASHTYEYVLSQCSTKIWVKYASNQSLLILIDNVFVNAGAVKFVDIK